MATTKSDPGDVFRSRFELRRELGRGGMGEVHLDRSNYCQCEFAIKRVIVGLTKHANEHRLHAGKTG